MYLILSIIKSSIDFLEHSVGHVGMIHRYILFSLLPTVRDFEFRAALLFQLVFLSWLTKCCTKFKVPHFLTHSIRCWLLIVVFQFRSFKTLLESTYFCSKQYSYHGLYFFPGSYHYKRQKYKKIFKENLKETSESEFVRCELSLKLIIIFLVAIWKTF